MVHRIEDLQKIKHQSLIPPLCNLSIYPSIWPSPNASKCQMPVNLSMSVVLSLSLSLLFPLGSNYPLRPLASVDLLNTSSFSVFFANV